MNNVYKKLMLISLVGINGITIHGEVELNTHDEAFKKLKKILKEDRSLYCDSKFEQNLALLIQKCQKNKSSHFYVTDSRKTVNCDNIRHGIDLTLIKNSTNTSILVLDSAWPAAVGIAACFASAINPLMLLPSALIALDFKRRDLPNYISPKAAQQLKDISVAINNAPTK